MTQKAPPPVIDINWNPTRRELRVFALLLVSFCAVVALGLSRRTESPIGPWAVFLAGSAIGLVGLVAPDFVRRIYVGWMVLVWPIGWVVSHVVLALVYYLVLTPIGLALRLCRPDPLGRRPDRSATTYWQPRPPADKPDRYFRQS